MKFLIAVAMLCGMTMQAQAPTTLNALRDVKRVLLVFADGHDPRVEDQWAVLVQHKDDAAERDLTTVLLTRSAVKKHDGESAPYANFSAAEEQAVRRRFHVSADEFTVILIGKDGGEKLRSHQPISWQNLGETIDVMPMRRDEMRQRR